MTRKSFFTKSILAFILILIVAAFLRLHRISDLAHFGYDEARDAIIERQMVVTRRLTLLGPESLIGNKLVYYGPLHYYLMAPALWASNFNVLGPYVWTAILGVATTVFIYLFSRSIPSAAFYAVFPLAVIYNRWAWNPNTVPLFSALFLGSLVKRHFFWAGFFFGLAVQLHITAAALVLVALFFLWKNWDHKNILWFLVGTVFGISPMIIFDLRHDFLYLRSALNLGAGTLSQNRTMTWHYFLGFVPVLAYLLKYLPQKVGWLLIVTSFLVSSYWLFTQVPDIPKNPARIQQISKIIAQDSRTSSLPFNVASLVDGDARATAYRYFLGIEGVRPKNEAEYAIVDHLYVVSFESADKVLYNPIYEVSSLGPKRISKIWQFGDEHLYRLERN